MADRARRRGFCGASDKVSVNIHQLHFGEEPVLSGTRGSGAIFFAHCNLRCVFCQNFEISYYGHGVEVAAERLSEMMLELQSLGAHNINLVTPTHYATQLRDVLLATRSHGLKIPVVWNSNGYEDPEVLKTLEGLVDIYLPDFKYSDPAMGARYSGVDDYPRWVKAAIKEMFRQVGHLRVDDDGVATGGLLIRILALPGDANGVKGVLSWIRDELGAETHISLMGQYYPTHRAGEFPEIDRPVAADEYASALAMLEAFGFENGFIQEVGSSSALTPAFKK